MQRKKSFLGLVLLVAAIIGGQTFILSKGKGNRDVRKAKFRVRIENISNDGGLQASTGTKWPFALSPGMWVVDKKDNLLFDAGKKARANGLEAQAEDGNPETLVKVLEVGHHSAMQHGVFNVPVGSSSPGPAGPGGVYEFTFNAEEGMRLSLITMFGQSNDLFYAPEKAIDLFDDQGQPFSGDITNKIKLWDAGTEVNQEPGIGPDQAPRQGKPNTGQPENKNISPVKDQYSYPSTEQLMRITIMPVSEM